MKDQAGRLQSPPSGTATQAVLISILIVATTLSVFWPVLQCDFLNYDDDGYVTANPQVLHGLTGGGGAWAFATGATGNWHPLTWLSLMLNAQLFGPGAMGFHLVNLLLHAANAALLFLVLLKLTGARWRSAIVAGLFALHPLHVESVAWVAERKDVLSAFFFMLTLLAYSRFVKESKVCNPKSKVFYVLALVMFAGGLMSKPMLVTMPFVLLLLDFWPLQRFTAPTIASLLFEKIPFFLLSAVLSVVTFIVQKQGEAVQTLTAFPIGMRVETALVSYGRYLEKTLWPVNLAVPYPYPTHWPMMEVALAAALVTVMSWLALKRARQHPFLAVGWFWFMGMLLPVIGLVQVGTQPMADRYTYLPLIGIFMGAAWGTGEIVHRWNLPKELVAAAMAVILVACAIQTRHQISHWQNGETLFEHAIAVTKNNATAYKCLGDYYLQNKGQAIDAKNCYQKAIEMEPNQASAYINLGSVFLLEGDLDKAAEQFNTVLKLFPGNAEADCDLGYISASRGQWGDAIVHYNKAIEKKPDFASAYHNRGLAFAAQGNWTNAVQDYRAAINLDPNHVSTHDDLAAALAHEGKRVGAIQEYQEALRLNPNDAEALRQLQMPGK